jgi:hypothetical protein
MQTAGIQVSAYGLFNFLRNVLPVCVKRANKSDCEVHSQMY